MDLFHRDDLRKLLNAPSGPRVSLTMPTDRSGRGKRECPIRFRNLVAEAETRLMDLGMRRPDARAMLAPLHSRMDDAMFWAHQSDGLAMFVAKDFFQSWRLPITFDECVCASRERFHLRPLLPALQGNGAFLLAVSLKTIQFFGGNRYGLSPLAPQGLPKALTDALDVNEYEEMLKIERFGRAGVRAENSHAGFQHDQDGAGQEYKKGEGILPFFRRLNDGLDNFFKSETAPLVFAGVDYLFPLFRQACSYRNLIDQPVEGNPEGWNEKELHARAWPVVEPYFTRQLQPALEKYGNQAAHGMGSADLAAIITAAHEGRVDTLFVARGKSCWGRVDETTGVTVLGNRPTDSQAEDLVDHAVTQTLMQNGTVYQVDESQLPAGDYAAAIFRFTNPGRVFSGTTAGQSLGS
jgi:hypothetical protein